MNVLVSMSAGRRPKTAQASIDALRLMDPWLVEHLTIVQWAPKPFLNAGGIKVVQRLGASRAQAHNTALYEHRREHGNPDRWLILDDDVVICWGLFERMNAVLEADPDIWILGAWNDGAERNTDGSYRGEVRIVAGETIQYGNDFCVGGAIQMWRRETIEAYGGYDESRPWLEDSSITQRVRDDGHHAVIARTIFGVILRDDNVDPSYRPEQIEGFSESFSHHHGGMRYKWPS